MPTNHCNTSRVRGPDYINSFFKKEPLTFLLVMSFFGGFRAELDSTRSIESMLEHLKCLLQMHDQDIQLMISSLLSKVESAALPNHEIQRICFEEYEESIEGYGSDLMMSITLSNLDTGKEPVEFTLYKDSSIGWWLRVYAIEEQYFFDHVVAKCHRVLHNGTSLFLSSAGKKTLFQLGIKAGDEIVIGGIKVEETDVKKKPLKTKKNNNNKKKKCGSKKKKKARPPPSTPTLSEEQLKNKWRQDHSRSFTPVLEEMESSKLKAIRNQLNNMKLKKTTPKARQISRRKKNKSSTVLLTLTLPSDSQGGKAGKVSYPVLVGEVTNLYKTRNTLTKAPITIDLHGLSKDEALYRLNTILPSWVKMAMEGNYPFVIPVDIICGGGTQILSEAVKNWIRRNRQVANRPKGYV